MSIYHLAYHSRAIGKMNGEALKEILKVASNRNRAEGITGFLFFRAGKFMQLLEGDQEKVSNCFERIKRDGRHRSVTKFAEFLGEKRLAPNWSMSLVSDEVDGADPIIDLIESGRGSLLYEAPEEVEACFRLFLRNRKPIQLEVS